MTQTLWDSALVAEIEGASEALDRLADHEMMGELLLSAEAATGTDGTTAGAEAARRHRLALDSVLASARLSSDLIRTWHRTVASTEAVSWASDLAAPPAGMALPLTPIVGYGNRSLDHAIVKAAVLYARTRAGQPFAVGNGRVARLLVFWALGRRWRVLPPISRLWSTDPARHQLAYAGSADNPETWIRLFAEDLRYMASASLDLTVELAAVRRKWLDERPGRAGSLRRRLLIGLTERPTIDSEVARTLYGADATRFSRVARELVADGILQAKAEVPSGVGRPRTRYEAPAVRTLIDRSIGGLAPPPISLPGVPAMPAAGEIARSTRRRSRPVPSKVRRPSVS